MDSSKNMSSVRFSQTTRPQPSAPSKNTGPVAPSKIRTKTLKQAFAEEEQFVQQFAEEEIRISRLADRGHIIRPHFRKYRSKLELIREAKKKIDFANFDASLEKFARSIHEIDIPGNRTEQIEAQNMALHVLADWAFENKRLALTWEIRKIACKLYAEISRIDRRYIMEVVYAMQKSDRLSPHTEDAVKYQIVSQVSFYVKEDDPSSILTGIAKVHEMNWSLAPGHTLNTARRRAYLHIADWARFCQQNEIAENIEALIALST